jgi:hypothetical protein
MAAMRAGQEWDQASRDAWWIAYQEWLEPIIWPANRWAIIPDSPGAPSQINDGLLNDWRFGRSKGAPVWHMDGPIERLARLCERYDRVCLGWIGDPKREPVGCEAYLQKMDQVAALMGNAWHPLHMLRGTAVARLYPFVSADSTSLAQNGHRYDWMDENPRELDFICVNGIWQMAELLKWGGRNRYADKLERGHWYDGRRVLRRRRPDYFDERQIPLFASAA